MISGKLLTENEYRQTVSTSRFCVQVYKHRIQLTRLNAGRKRGQGWRTGEM